MILQNANDKLVTNNHMHFYLPYCIMIKKRWIQAYPICTDYTQRAQRNALFSISSCTGAKASIAASSLACLCYLRRVGTRKYCSCRRWHTNWSLCSFVLLWLFTRLVENYTSHRFTVTVR